MKRHHIAAIFLFICGGLLTYTIYQQDPDEAIRWAIMLYLFGTIIFFYEKLPTWFRPIVIVLPVIGAGYIAYVHFVSGNIVLTFVTCFAVIIVGVPMLNRDKPTVPDALRPWLKPAPYVGIVVSLVSLVVWLLSLLPT